MRAGNLDGILSKKAFASVVRYTLVASTGMVILSATSAAADDTAAFQRLEAKIQQLETRHENEIKALQAEIRRLRREKPVRGRHVATASTAAAIFRAAVGHSSSRSAGESPDDLRPRLPLRLFGCHRRQHG
jgi:hypothetical protein